MKYLQNKAFCLESISFTHHISILTGAKELDEGLFYIRYCHNYKSTVDDLERELGRALYHHQGSLPNNFLANIPDYKQAFRAIRMFKDDYLIDFINVEELGMRDEDVDVPLCSSLRRVTSKWRILPSSATTCAYSTTMIAGGGECTCRHHPLDFSLAGCCSE